MATTTPNLSANWNRENLAWLSGLVEGEGSVSVHPQLRIAMKDRDVLERAQTIAGTGSIRPVNHSNPKWSPYWTWCVGSHRHTYALLVAMWPWLGERRRREWGTRIRTYLARPAPERWRHGTVYAWRHHCKCELCIDAAKTYYARAFVAPTGGPTGHPRKKAV